MFKLGRVTDSELMAVTARAATLEPTYDFEGATLTDTAPAGFRRDRYEIVLADRPDAFERGADGLRQWAAHLGAGLRVAPRDPPTLDATVTVAIATGPLTAVAVCRIVALIDEPSRFGFAYGTFRAIPSRARKPSWWSAATGRAVFEVIAISRPVEFVARAGGPITRRIQQATTRRYLAGVESFVESEK